MKEQLPLSVWGLSSQGVEQFGRSEAFVSGLREPGKGLMLELNRTKRRSALPSVRPCVARQPPPPGQTSMP
jgi:hypothetical protein